MAESEETIARANRDLSPAAAANEHLAEIGMTDRHILSQVAHTVAQGAIRIAERVDPWISRG